LSIHPENKNVVVPTWRCRW